MYIYRKVGKWLFRVLLVLFGAHLSVFFFLYGYQSKSFDEISIEDLQNYDAVIVFFSDFENDAIDKESLRRLNTAIHIYGLNNEIDLIFVGGARPTRDLFGSEQMAEIAIARGIRKEKVYFEKNSRHTTENWNEAKKILKEKKYRSYALLSSIYHITRLKYLLIRDAEINSGFIYYNENNIQPKKNIIDSYFEYNYNILSGILYLVLPKSGFEKFIYKLRK